MGKQRSAPPGKYKDFGKRLEIALRNIGKYGTNVEIGKFFGVSGAAANYWLNGDKLPSPEMLIKMSKKLKVTTDWLLTGEMVANADNLPNFDKYEVKSYTRLGKVPLISYDQAGEWCDVEDPYALNDAERWLDSVIDHSDKAFCLRIKGDSMYDGTPRGYPDGCIAQFDPTIRPRHKDDVIVRTPDDKTTFKQLHITPEGQYLVAINPDHPQRVIEVPEGTVIVAVCQGYWFDRGR